MPRCLEAMLTAELTDNEGWRMLIELAESMNRKEMAREFSTALDNEQKHLGLVRSWLSAAMPGR